MTDLYFLRILQFITSIGCVTSIIWLNWTLRNLEKDLNRLSHVMLEMVRHSMENNFPLPKNVFPLKFDS
jgi:hypothetical protein